MSQLPLPRPPTRTFAPVARDGTTNVIGVRGAQTGTPKNVLPAPMWVRYFLVGSDCRWAAGPRGAPFGWVIGVSSAPRNWAYTPRPRFGQFFTSKVSVLVFASNLIESP